LKSEKKAAEEAAKREVISLEDFLETEVSNAEFAFHVEIARTNGLLLLSSDINSKHHLLLSHQRLSLYGKRLEWIRRRPRRKPRRRQSKLSVQQES
jgi:hypothetical protein